MSIVRQMQQWPEGDDGASPAIPTRQAPIAWARRDLHRADMATLGRLCPPCELRAKRKLIPRGSAAQPAGAVAISEAHVAAAARAVRAIIDLIIGAAAVGANETAIIIAAVVLVPARQ